MVDVCATRMHALTLSWGKRRKGVRLLSFFGQCLYLPCVVTTRLPFYKVNQSHTTFSVISFNENTWLGAIFRHVRKLKWNKMKFKYFPSKPPRLIGASVEQENTHGFDIGFRFTAGSATKEDINLHIFSLHFIWFILLNVIMYTFCLPLFSHYIRFSGTRWTCCINWKPQCPKTPILRCCHRVLISFMFKNSLLTLIMAN